MPLFTKKTAIDAGPTPPLPTPAKAESGAARPAAPPSKPPEPAHAPPRESSEAKRDPLAAERIERFHKLKTDIHRKLVEQLDMTKLAQNVTDEIRDQVFQIEIGRAHV